MTPAITLPSILTPAEAKKLGIKQSISDPLPWPDDRPYAEAMLHGLRHQGVTSAIVITRGTSARGTCEVWRTPRDTRALHKNSPQNVRSRARRLVNLNKAKNLAN